MSLYRQALNNSFATYSRKNAKYLAVDAALEAALGEAPSATEEPAGPLAAALAQASAELRQVLSVIMNGPQELLVWLIPDKPPEESFEGALSRSWCRLVKTENLRSDLVSELRERLRDIM